MKLIPERDLNVQYLDMPTTVHGRTIPNEDGSYTVILNSRLSHDGQLRAWDDETEHINSDHLDYDNGKTVQEMECESHKIEMVKQVVPTAKRKLKRKLRHKSKWKRLAEERKFLESIGFDFMADAERRYLEPER